MRSDKRRMPAAVVGALLAGVAWVVVAGLVALGHTTLTSSSPDHGARLAERPAAVELTFSEPVETGLSRFEVFRLDVPADALDDPVHLEELAGRWVAQASRSRRDEAPRVDTGLETDDPRSRTVRIGLPADLEPGAYAVLWRVLSADSHVVQGFIVFVYEPAGP